MQTNIYTEKSAGLTPITFLLLRLLLIILCEAEEPAQQYHAEHWNIFINVLQT